MRAWLVTSRVTFVPRNYDDLILPLARCPEVCGLFVLDNRSPRLALQAIGVGLLGAPRIGGTLLANILGWSMARRRRAYAAERKPVRVFDTIHSPEVLALCREEAVDVIVNARTREIYRPEVLAAPRLGCINVHHGLLPEARGTMCDLWALHEQQPAGFSIHEMTERVDAGSILDRVVVDTGAERSYPRYLQRAARAEVEAVAGALAAIGERGALAGEPNIRPKGNRFRRNPTWREIRAMRRGGLRL